MYEQEENCLREIIHVCKYKSNIYIHITCNEQEYKHRYNHVL